MNVVCSVGIGALRVNMMVRCVFPLESPHRGDSNEYTQYTIFYLH